MEAIAKKWNYFSSENGIYAVTNGDNVIAISGEEHYSDNEKNAKLIVSAPELLYKSRQLLSALDYGKLGKYQLEVINGLEEAIKKATE